LLSLGRFTAAAVAATILMIGCTGAPESQQTGPPASRRGGPSSVDVSGVALSVLRSPELAMRLSVSGTFTYGQSEASVSGTGELRPDASHLLLSIATRTNLSREGVVARGAAYHRAEGGPWIRERPGPVPRDPADAGATIRLNRLIGKLQGLTVVGPASAGGDQLFRLAPLPGFQVTPRDFGLDASTAGFMGSMGVMATADGTPSGLVLDAGWPESPTSDTGPGISSSWHLEVSMSESEPTRIGPPRNRWPSFASERDGYRIAYPPSWSVAKCKVGGLIGRCLSAGNGSAELLIRRFAPAGDWSLERLAAHEEHVLREGAGLKAVSAEELELGLQPATLRTFEGWKASVRELLTLRGNDAYALVWMSRGHPNQVDRARLGQFLTTFEPSGATRRAGSPVGPRVAAVPQLATGTPGPAVLSLQARLAGLHYDVGAVNGRFASDTRHAVVAFQKVNGLPRTGAVDPRTWSALFRPAVPAARYRYRGASIEVDLTRQVVYLVRDGAIERILDASTGGGYEFVSRGVHKVAITPTGTYRIQMQIDGWYESSVGWMYRSSFFLRGFALHGEGSVPPYPASHGCVRVTLSAIDRLWPSLYLGMPVSIYRS